MSSPDNKTTVGAIPTPGEYRTMGGLGWLGRQGGMMIVREEYIEGRAGGLINWHIVKWLLFGKIPLYVKRTKIK